MFNFLNAALISFHVFLFLYIHPGGMYGVPPMVDRYGLPLPMAHATMVRTKLLYIVLVSWCYNCMPFCFGQMHCSTHPLTLTNTTSFDYLH